MRKHSKCISKRSKKISQRRTVKKVRRIETTPGRNRVGTLLLGSEKWWSRHYIFSIIKKIKYFSAKMEGMRFIE